MKKHSMKPTRSVEELHHFSCAACKKWWTVADAPENKREWFCPWCGNVQQFESNRE
ncbi:MAG: hypothetical protein Q7R85_00050 [bacterium]|nr:hypothetical protein [bacterium]